MVRMTPWVLRLILANFAMFLIVEGQVLSDAVLNALVLYPSRLPFRPWTAITYMFLHAGFAHLLFNMLGLFFFGPQLEQRLGGPRFVWLYFLSGLGGAAASFVFAPSAGVVGASGAVFGVLFAYARFWPRNLIYIWGVFPVQARWLIVFYVILSLLGVFGGTQPGIAHFAHLGGFGGGALYLAWLGRRPAHQRRFEAKLREGSRRSPTDDDLRRWKSIDREDLHEVNREHFDRVMAKIEESGVGSLSSEDRAFLDRFASR